MNKTVEILESSYAAGGNVNCVMALEDRAAVPQIGKPGAPRGPSNSIPRKNENIPPHKNLCIIALFIKAKNSIVYKSPKLEITQLFTSWWID